MLQSRPRIHSRPESPEYISKQFDIPTIGIGAGVSCDGQVLVLHDMLGLFERLTPALCQKIRSPAWRIVQAFGKYISEVEARNLPREKHSLSMPPAEWEAS